MHTDPNRMPTFDPERADPELLRQLADVLSRPWGTYSDLTPAQSLATMAESCAEAMPILLQQVIRMARANAVAVAGGSPELAAETHRQVNDLCRAMALSSGLTIMVKALLSGGWPEHGRAELLRLQDVEQQCWEQVCRADDIAAGCRPTVAEPRRPDRRNPPRR